ncbi:hypothetical protein BH09ACT1_BH09ACT1_22140 [soil metagenome]
MAARSLPFWVRSVRARPAAAACLAVLSAGAVILSTLAPLLLSAVEQFTLTDTLAATSPARTSVIGLAEVNGGLTRIPLVAVKEIAAAVPHRLYAPGQIVVEANESFAWTINSTVTPPQEVSLSAPGAGCGKVRMVAGHCPTDDGQMMVAATLARSAKVSVGDAVTVSTSGFSLGPFAVSGIYDSTTSGGRFLAHPSAEGGLASRATPDLVISHDQFQKLRFDGVAYSLSRLRLGLRMGDIDAALDGVDAAQTASGGLAGARSSARVHADLREIIVPLDAKHAAAAVTLSIVALEALGLAWFAESLVIQRIGRARAGEWGIARLRGLPRHRWLATVFLEPSIALLSGAILGAVASPAAASVAARLILGPGAIVDTFQPAFGAVIGLALAGSFVALVAASIRSARLPLAELLRETTEPRQLSRLALIAQTAVVLVTAVVIYTLITGGRVRGAQVGLLAPGLIAVFIGIVGLRVAVLLVRRMTQRPPRSLTGLVVGRQLARAPSVLYGAVVICVGVAVAAFSVQFAVLAVDTQKARAEASVGASTVLTVDVPGSVSFVSAVRAADPGGKTAMAVEEVSGGEGSARIIAVDSSRLAAVSSWSPEWSGMSSSRLIRRLAPKTGKSLLVQGSQLALTLADVDDGAKNPINPAVRLKLVLQNSSGWHTVNLGMPEAGTKVRTIPCVSSCRVVWFGTVDSEIEPQPYRADFTLTAVSTDKQPDLSAVLVPDNWRNRIGSISTASQPASGKVTATSTGMRISFSDEDGTNIASIASRDAPEPLPVLAGPEAKFIPFAGLGDAYSGTGLDQSSRVITLVGRADVLPRLMGNGVLADLTLMSRISNPAGSTAAKEVWLAPGRHPAVLKALRMAGIRITGRESLATVTTTFEREAPTRAAVLGIAIAIVALLLTLLTAIALRIVGARGRQRDWQSLRAAGVSKARLRNMLRTDVFVPAAIAVVLGIGAGILAFVLIAPRLTLVPGVSALPPVDALPSAFPLAVIGLDMLVALALVALVSARVEVSE